MNTLRVIGQQQQMRGLFVVLSPHPPKWSHIASVTAVVVLSCWACPAKSTVLHLMDGWVDGRMLLMNYIIIITKWFIELRILSQIGLWLAGWLFVVVFSDTSCGSGGDRLLCTIGRLDLTHSLAIIHSVERKYYNFSSTFVAGPASSWLAD